MSKSGFDRSIGPKEAPKFSEYNFNIDGAATVSAIGRIKDTKWPRPLQSDPAQRGPNLLCKYHGAHGRRTKDCRQLREEVARLFNNEHLREFLSDQAENHFRNRDSNKQTEQEEPQHVINMIISRVDVPQGPMLKRTKVSITREKLTRDYLPEGTLSFNDEDTEGSSADIIRSRVVEQPGLQDQIVPTVRVLNGFNMAFETTKREITLPGNTTGTIQETKFYLIEEDIRNNALFGRPWIHNVRAVLSTLHQVLKFPMPGGIKTIYGEQSAAKEMFAVNEVVLISALSTPKDPSLVAKEDTK
ncbi:PREDICTED: uncharacterized protein LOC109214199 [Nicotiana attenuata]|uniref:uncharacterized protein LOC109214199 n=1 Tax=Nicotiana attenuata TaxID=49451 RepID=UPI000904FEF4|nr:PREDICTED: uncharacterized protein LOC109214199 [Nicotiana attenuata]